MRAPSDDGNNCGNLVCVMRWKVRIMPLRRGLRSCCPAGALLPSFSADATSAADADCPDQAPGLAVLAAVGEQQLRLARGAQPEVGDVRGRNAGALELPAVGEREIEVQLGADGLAVSRSARGKEEERIAVVYGVGVVELLEQLAGVRE